MGWWWCWCSVAVRLLVPDWSAHSVTVPPVSVTPVSASSKHGTVSVHRLRVSGDIDGDGCVAGVVGGVGGSIVSVGVSPAVSALRRRRWCAGVDGERSTGVAAVIAIAVTPILSDAVTAPTASPVGASSPTVNDWPGRPLG